MIDISQQRWEVVNDDVMGGRSDGCCKIEDGVLSFYGSLSTDGGGFASVRSTVRQPPDADTTAFTISVRGDGRTYKMRVIAGDEPVNYSAEFSTEPDVWRDVTFPVDAFRPTRRGKPVDAPPLDPAQVSSIGFLIADKTDGAFRLEVASIELSRRSPDGR